MIKSLKNVELKNKKVLLRIDLNVPRIDNEILDYKRIEKIIPTINYLIKSEAKIIIISHYDRPGGKYVESMSLKFAVEALSKFIPATNIYFSRDLFSDQMKKQILSLQNGEIILLENIRFAKQEEDNDHDFAQRISNYADIYINDAFSCSHRAHASIEAITNYLPSYGGFLLINEIDSLSNIFNDDSKSITAIIGGSKISTKLNLLSSISKKVDRILVGGGIANNFIKMMGNNIGGSLYEKNMINETLQIMKNINANNCELILPIDAVIAKNIEDKFSVKISDIDKIDDQYSIFDIGPKTIDLFVKNISKSQICVWNGPLGVFEHNPFNLGTANIALNLASKTNSGDIKTIAGGGDIIAALSNNNLDDSFTYISTAGGAFLEWLEGRDLPGISALLK